MQNCICKPGVQIGLVLTDGMYIRSGWNQGERVQNCICKPGVQIGLVYTDDMYIRSGWNQGEGVQNCICKPRVQIGLVHTDGISTYDTDGMPASHARLKSAGRQAIYFRAEP